MIFIKILVLNSGSSSLKYQLIDMSNEKILCKGSSEKIGGKQTEFFHKALNKKLVKKKLPNIKTHIEAFKYIKSFLLDKTFGVISSVNEIFAVGHRVVHGGIHFNLPAIIDNSVIKKINSLVPLAPLHNKASLEGIKSCMEIFGKNIPQVAVFDTSFYANLPQKAYIYPIPYRYFEKYNIRKYGFHGTSHEYVSQIASKVLKKDISKLKIISCHLGNGSSITAIKNGKAIDTSMGLTPLGGVMMGTRCGSLDPSVVIQMAKEESLSLDELTEILNKNSGLKGISGICNDDREIQKAEENGNLRAKLSHEMMIYQINKYIGSYIAVMGGCDVIIFTGGIGQNQWMHREKICKNFEFLDLKLDEEKNKQTTLGKLDLISLKNSKIDVLVIPTNEELAIAKKVLKTLKEAVKA